MNITEKTILKYAHIHAIDLWHAEQIRFEKNPNNYITKARVDKRWEEVKAIEALLLEAEQKEAEA